MAEPAGTAVVPSRFRGAARKLAASYGLAGVKLVISDAHEGIKAAVAHVFRASWQRCRVHFMRNALDHAGRSGRRVVSAFIATAFAQDDAGAARARWRQVADQVRTKLPKLAALLDEAEQDVLAYMSFPKEHRAKIHSTNPVKRRTEVVGRRSGAGNGGSAKPGSRACCAMPPASPARRFWAIRPCVGS